MPYYLLLLIDDEDDRIKFEKLYNDNHKAFLSYAKAFLNNRDDAEQAVNGAFVRIAKNFEKILSKDIVAVNAFMYTILKNECRTILKNKLKYESHIVLKSDMEIACFVDYDENIENKMRIEKLMEEIKAMPYELKDVLMLHYVSGLSISKTAKVLNIPVSTVKYRLEKGVKILTEKFKEVDSL